MKIVFLCCFIIVCLTGCASVSTVNTDYTVNSSEVSDIASTTDIDSNAEKTINTSEYNEVFFKDFPDSFEETCTVNGKVLLTGYFTDEVSNDKSTGYLTNTGHGVVTDSNTIGKAIPLDLTNVTITDTGGNYVKVFGTVVNETRVDIYGIKSEFFIKVDSITVTEDVKESIKQYNDFVDSNQFEALARVINMIGSVCYKMTDTESNDSTVEKVECDFESLINDNRSEYPLIYEVLENPLQQLQTYYNQSIDFIDNGTVPEDVNAFSDDFMSLYEEVTTSLENLALFD